MSASPVIIVCYGWHDGLSAMLESLKAYSPKTPVHVIGNQVTRQHIECASVEAFGEYATKFACVYEHHSPNGEQFELQCFMRWFVALEFMVSRQIESAWLLDWDVLVLCNLNDYDQENTVPIGACCHMDITCLAHWCHFLFITYHSKPNLNEFVEKMKAGDLKWPVISDMSLAEWWGREEKLIDPFAPDETNEVFDPNISTDDHGFVVELGTKRIRFENGYALAYNAKSHSWVRMLTLHFQGDRKRLMAGTLKKAMESKHAAFA